jgi:ABC-type transport system substrate-binding protein
MSTTILTLIILSLYTYPILGKTMKENSLKVSVFPVAEIDPSKVQTAGQFILLHHLLRPLTKLDSTGQIEGDLVESWRIKENYQLFIFKIKFDAKWSDGSNITSKDVKEALTRQIKLNTANHFNFENIKSIEILNDREFSIRLKKSDVLFIRQISYPEFGIVNFRDNKLDFLKTSGPFILEKQNEKALSLKKNNYYTSNSPETPTHVEFKLSKPSDVEEMIKKNELDFAVPHSTKEEVLKEIAKLENYKISEPHIGYSFWMSINPESTVINNIIKRRFIQNLIHTEITNTLKNYEYLWKEARQLYLPDGLGRLKENEVDDIWKQIKEDSKTNPFSGKEIHILTRTTFPFNSEIIQSFERSGIKTKVTVVETSQEMWAKQKEVNYDLCLRSNDFSSIDLHENIQTTFNPIHTLIHTDKEDDQFQKELQEALTIEDTGKRNEIYKMIASKVLLKGYIAPIAYYKIVFVHKKNIDLSSWSKLFPEISLWKIKLLP